MSRPRPGELRLVVGLLAGVVVAVVTAALGAPRFAPLVGWDVAAAVFLAWTWPLIWWRDARSTREHARGSEPNRPTADVVLLAAAVASLAAVVAVIFSASSSHGWGEIGRVGLGIASVVASWAVVHTVFCLRYARLYYTGAPGGVDFHGPEEPGYSDFAYLAFTIGMTFQVSDTDLESRAIRATALRHALISFLFATVIVSLTINLVAGLSK